MKFVSLFTILNFTLPFFQVTSANARPVQLSGEWPKGSVPMITGGPLGNFYEFAQLHFHWGGYDNSGSEHTILGESFPLELHAVHWNKKYGNMSEATKYSDGLAVLGYLIRIDRFNDQNAGIKKMMTYFSKISQPNQETRINPLPLTAFNMEIIADEYITYLGSLTTPPCSESVIWLVAGNNLPGITRRMMSSFRRLQLSNHDDHNFRPVQPLNGRRVFYIQSY